jgi:hypothetical protein
MLNLELEIENTDLNLLKFYINNINKIKTLELEKLKVNICLKDL